LLDHIERHPPRFGLRLSFKLDYDGGHRLGRDHLAKWLGARAHQ
jgi:hypothetical protein